MGFLKYQQYWLMEEQFPQETNWDVYNLWDKLPIKWYSHRTSSINSMLCYNQKKHLLQEKGFPETCFRALKTKLASFFSLHGTMTYTPEN